MKSGDAPGDLWIVGPGRLGLALGHAIVGCGWTGRLSYLGRRSAGEVSEGQLLGARYGSLQDGPGSPPPDVIILTVPDAAVSSAAAAIAALDLSPGIALHTSGALASAALASLSATGWRVGSMHPLVAVPDPESGARKLIGAWYGIEGDSEAVRVARMLVETLRGHELVLEVGTKPLYHAAAVMASNHVVALLNVATRMMARCGIDPVSGTVALGTLARGAVDDVSTQGTLRALTGPVVRGDVDTIRAHRDQLSRDESRLYSVLAREALRIAAARGLSPDAVATIEAILLEELG